MEKTEENTKKSDRLMISVIIPTLNEQENLGTLLEALGVETSIDYEIIIVDGGSEDATMEIAKTSKVLCLQGPRGRGQQLCKGIESAQGDILLFLHADSTISGHPLAAIKKTLDQTQDYIGGNFSLIFDGNDDFSFWLNGFYKWLRARGIYYGDSGIFIRRSALEQIGGFSNRALMEDYDLVKRMEKFGSTCNITDPVLVTSSRRFHGRSKWSIIWGWIKIHFLYYIGCSDEYLARTYDSARSTEKAPVNRSS